MAYQLLNFSTCMTLLKSYLKTLRSRYFPAFKMRKLMQRESKSGPTDIEQVSDGWRI